MRMFLVICFRRSRNTFITRHINNHYKNSCIKFTFLVSARFLWKSGCSCYTCSVIYLFEILIFVIFFITSKRFINAFFFWNVLIWTEWFIYVIMFIITKQTHIFLLAFNFLMPFSYLICFYWRVLEAFTYL